MVVSLISFGLVTGASIGAILGTVKLLRLKKRFMYQPQADTSSLPTVSICIPARNEIHAMTRCLESVIRSSYEKLEIIVLDDSSVDGTSVLIKSFAHAGVRFVEGSPLPDSWLGKNHALQGLLNEASGDIVIFMDVDTVIAPETIGQLVAQQKTDGLAMLSVIPQRLDGWRTSVMMGSLRQLWTLLLVTDSSPAVSSALWCIKREELLEIGGFEALRLVVQPEVAIAAHFSSDHQFRTFLSNRELRIGVEKKWGSQAETSIRLLVPIAGGGIMAIAWLVILAVLSLAWLATPFLFVFQSPIFFAALFYTLTMALLFCTYYSIIWGRLWVLGGLIMWPFVLIQEAILLSISIVQYKRGRVGWKGRLIANKVQR